MLLDSSGINQMGFLLDVIRMSNYSNYKLKTNVSKCSGIEEFIFGKIL